MEDKKPEVKPISLTEFELQNLIVIVSTHPTPEGIGSDAGKIKYNLVNKLRQMKEAL